MERGAIIEAVVLAKSSLINKGFRRDTFFVLAGNNRIHAAQLIDETQVGAYVVKDASKDAIDKFIRTDNMKHGIGYTEDEKIAQIIDLHVNHKASIRNMCKEFFGKRHETIYQKIRARLRGQEVRRELIRQGFEPSKLGDKTHSVLEELHKISPTSKSNRLGNKNLLAKAFRNTIECGLNVDEVRDMVKEVREHKTEKEQMKVLEQIDKQRSKRRRQTKTMAEFVAFQRKLTDLHKLLLIGKNGKPFRTFKDFGSEDEKKIEELLDKMNEITLAFKSLKGGRRLRRKSK